jgi:hypothetical protein
MSVAESTHTDARLCVRESENAATFGANAHDADSNQTHTPFLCNNAVMEKRALVRDTDACAATGEAHTRRAYTPHQCGM